MEQDNYLAVEPERPIPPCFRDDLRAPTAQFGRCAITGQFGLVAAVDLGDISIEAPLTDRGVIYDPETKEVTFTAWRPVTFAQQLTVSAAGIKMLLGMLENSDMPLPKITPKLVYQWEVMYEDGTAVRQFSIGEDGAEQEQSSRVVNWERVKQVSVVARPGNELPTYTVTYGSGGPRFFKQGIEITNELDYDGDIPVSGAPFYARSVSHTFGSGIGIGLERQITNAASSVVQLIGWRVGFDDPTDPSNAHRQPCCIIGIDERGNWRPKYYFGENVVN